MKALFISISLLLSILVQSQETKKAFTDKTHQHTISTEYLALSYTYAYKFKPKLNIGYQLELGLASRFLLSGSNYNYNDRIMTQSLTNQILDKKPDAFQHYVDIIKFQAFYRPAFGKHFYLDIGPYISYGAVLSKTNQTINSATDQYSFGIESSIFYTFWKMHIGSRFQLGKQFSRASKPNTYYYGIFFSPVVIGFSF